MRSLNLQTRTGRSLKSCVCFLLAASTMSLPMNGFVPSRLEAAGMTSVATIPNPLVGKYLGNLTGTLAGVGIPSQGLAASVDQSGQLTFTVPGLGTGTVTPNGQCRATARFVLNQNNLTVAFAGTLIAVKNPLTGKVISVIGVGTWRVTTPGMTGGGKWIIRRIV